MKKDKSLLRSFLDHVFYKSYFYLIRTDNGEEASGIVKIERFFDSESAYDYMITQMYNKFKTKIMVKTFVRV